MQAPINPSQQAYAQAQGTTPTGGAVIFQRDPTPQDIYYPLGQFWINQAGIRLFYLNLKSNQSGVLLATWELISTSSILVTLSDTANDVVEPSLPSDNPPDNIQLFGSTGIQIVSDPTQNRIVFTSTGSGAETLTGQDGVAVGPDITGTIFTLGNVVANSTHVVTGTTYPLYTFNATANTEQWDIQVAAAIASTDIELTGLAAFSEAQFSVDANGFVTLVGGSGPSLFTLTGNSGGPIGPDGSGNINTLGTGSITIVGSGHTLTTELTGLTNHNVLIGAGTATITKVAPSAASGIPLISQGSSSDPAFGTAVVAGGGTGDTSFTAYAVITGGTTAAGNLQNVSGVGTSGQVLTSNGAAALPTWQNSSASGSVTSFSPDTGGSVTPNSGVVTITGGTTTYSIGNSPAHNFHFEVQSTTNTILYGQGTDTPSITLGPFPNGSTIIGNAGVPMVNTLTAGSNITIVDGPGTITISASVTAESWHLIAANQVGATNSGYFCISPGGALTVSLPATSSVGDVFEVVLDGATSWQITQAAGQQIRVSSSQTTSGAGGSITTTAQGDSIKLICEIANLRWVSTGSNGNLTIT